MIPFKLYKNNSQFIKIKQYPNFVLYQNLKSGTLECFSYFELGHIKPSPKIKMANKNGAVKYV